MRCQSAQVDSAHRSSRPPAELRHGGPHSRVGRRQAEACGDRQGKAHLRGPVIPEGP